MDERKSVATCYKTCYRKRRCYSRCGCITQGKSSGEAFTAVMPLEIRSEMPAETSVVQRKEEVHQEEAE